MVKEPELPAEDIVELRCFLLVIAPAVGEFKTRLCRRLGVMKKLDLVAVEFLFELLAVIEAISHSIVLSDLSPRSGRDSALPIAQFFTDDFPDPKHNPAGAKLFYD